MPCTELYPRVKIKATIESSTTLGSQAQDKVFIVLMGFFGLGQKDRYRIDSGGLLA